MFSRAGTCPLRGVTPSDSRCFLHQYPWYPGLVEWGVKAAAEEVGVVVTGHISCFLSLQGDPGVHGLAGLKGEKVGPC